MIEILTSEKTHIISFLPVCDKWRKVHTVHMTKLRLIVRIIYIICITYEASFIQWATTADFQCRVEMWRLTAVHTRTTATQIITPVTKMLKQKQQTTTNHDSKRYSVEAEATSPSAVRPNCIFACVKLHFHFIFLPAIRLPVIFGIS